MAGIASVCGRVLVRFQRCTGLIIDRWEHELTVMEGVMEGGPEGVRE